MPKDFARHTRANNDARANRSAKKRAPAKRTTKSRPRSRVSPTTRTLFHGPSFSFGALLGAGVVILAAYAPEILQSANVPAPQAGDASEPATPQVEFEFPQLLRNSEVKADPTPYAVPEPAADLQPSSFNVQAASFRSRVDANKLRAQLLLQDLPATVSDNTVGSSTWHRVTVGPFARRIEAERALTRLREQGLDAMFVRG